MKLKKDNHLRIDGENLASELGYKSALDMRVALSKMQRMKPAFLNREELTDLTEIEIDESLTPEERALSLLRQTRNPYFYRYEGMIVTISDSERIVLDDFIANCIF